MVNDNISTKLQGTDIETTIANMQSPLTANSALKNRVRKSPDVEKVTSDRLVISNVRTLKHKKVCF